MDVVEGAVLAGKYRVERILGRGGMGVVVQATNLNLESRVALKFLRSDGLDQPIWIERFQREARAAARIRNPHIAQVLDVDTLPSGVPYIVMEYLEGKDLEAWLREQGPLPIAQAVSFLLQACEAIGEAHRVGVVHRDIKPANLFVTHPTDGEPFIKVLDFGISKIAQDSVGSVTTTKAFVGSPLYMSPEQMKSSRSADARSDIWSLGTVLFELLTGDLPFRGESVAELALKVALTTAPALTDKRPDASPELARVVAKCLEKEPAQRYASVAELVAALKSAAAIGETPAGRDSQSSAVKAIAPTLESRVATNTAALSPEQGAANPLAASGTESVWSQPEPAKPKSRSRWLEMSAGVLFVLGLGGVGTRYWNRSEELTPVSSSTSPLQTLVTPQDAVATSVAAQVEPVAATAVAAPVATVRKDLLQNNNATLPPAASTLPSPTKAVGAEQAKPAVAVVSPGNRTATPAVAAAGGARPSNAPLATKNDAKLPAPPTAAPVHPVPSPTPAVPKRDRANAPEPPRKNPLDIKPQ